MKSQEEGPSVPASSQHMPRNIFPSTSCFWDPEEEFSFSFQSSTLNHQRRESIKHRIRCQSMGAHICLFTWALASEPITPSRGLWVPRTAYMCAHTRVCLVSGQKSKKTNQKTTQPKNPATLKAI